MLLQGAPYSYKIDYSRFFIRLPGRPCYDPEFRHAKIGGPAQWKAVHDANCIDSEFPISRLYDQVDLGHKDVRTTVNTRVLNRGPRGVRSPMDKIPDG